MFSFIFTAIGNYNSYLDIIFHIYYITVHDIILRSGSTCCIILLTFSGSSFFIVTQITATFTTANKQQVISSGHECLEVPQKFLWGLPNCALIDTLKIQMGSPLRTFTISKFREMVTPAPPGSCIHYCRLCQTVTAIRHYTYLLQEMYKQKVPKSLRVPKRKCFTHKSYSVSVP